MICFPQFILLLLVTFSNIGTLFSCRPASTMTNFDKKSLQSGARQLLKTLQSRDVIFYQAPPNVNRTFFFMYISAGVQLLFWGNLAKNAPMILAPQGKRMVIAGGLVTVGLGVAAAMCTYPWR
ncbi:uncharacterized protein BX664DRAFT_262008 [Halteromyces radiatus]|uniref:uncharacterized protein n=1 Tax=Halteromyces radiatus TaxID=101107 RepID=UPI00221F7810|nr:uncharacterized protein BX664DRAFT_262008 [Halteromyces radiatus]KAI8089630.1 hypothetical protein BX664DRAFT_262008 [Halteromyces radiatus]